MLSLDDLKDYSTENCCSASGYINGLYVQVNYIRVYSDEHQFHDKTQIKTLINGKLRVISNAALRELILLQPSAPAAPEDTAAPIEAIVEASWLSYNASDSVPSTWSITRTVPCV